MSSIFPKQLQRTDFLNAAIQQLRQGVQSEPPLTHAELCSSLCSRRGLNYFRNLVNCMSAKSQASEVLPGLWGIYMCVCVCVCVAGRQAGMYRDQASPSSCMWWSQGERKRQKEEWQIENHGQKVERLVKLVKDRHTLVCSFVEGCIEGDEQTSYTVCVEGSPTPEYPKWSIGQIRKW